ncbi:tetratricopeptide repeat protein [Limnobaculum xujianqingii]|uniref:tetratricopeptide repeat protein n=1 Tax=Limnobaculum xujianqingii TaxID=2738837 RepID=UPI00112C0E2C|nr:tetratricopeptide repeat protein [Limnobaculum xujianqingii]
MRPVQNNRRSADLIAKQEQQFHQLASQFQEAMRKADYQKGKELAEATLRIMPRNQDVQASYALCLMRTGEYEKSYKLYKRLLKTAPLNQLPSTMIDGLTEVCGWLQRPEEVRRYGLMSLEEADKIFSAGKVYPLPTGNPPPFNPNNPQENVISFTLFGSAPRYCEAAVMNAIVSKDLFPDWECRFYLDDTVPQGVQERLSKAGANVIKVDEATRQALPALMWRFLVLDDPKVKRYIIRDADSLLSEREQAAINEWVNSDYWYHHIRDYFTHSELILAGLWGGCHNENLPSVIDATREYLSQQEAHKRFVDQYFLRQYIWPTVRQSVLSHDDIFGFHHAKPFPVHPPIRWKTNKFHVGSNASYQRVEVSSKLADGELQSWELTDENGVKQAEYRSVVHNGVWEEFLPFFTLDQINDKKLTIRNINTPEKA